MSSALSEYINSLYNSEGVLYEGDVPASSPTEKTYLNVRMAEERLYADHEVLALPDLIRHRHSDEWKMRAKSAARIKCYFQEKNSGNVLDLGCGNGWLTNVLAENANLEVVGIDLNRVELQQASRLFIKPNLKFVYGDILTLSLPWSGFDYITVSAAIQYFKNFKSLIDRLMILLKDKGELHIFDSPFYKTETVKEARLRSQVYYRNLGYGHMANHYHHHSYEVLENWNHEYLYVHQKQGFVKKIFGKKDMPFPWIKITKH